MRESIAQDYESFSSIYHMEGMEYVEPLESYEQFLSYLVNRYPFYGYGMWTITEKETGRVIGRAGLEEMEVEGKIYTQLGYLLSEDMRGRGIADQVGKAILDYAKDVLYIEEIHVFIHPKNTPSKKLAEKLGFRKMKRVFLQNHEEIELWSI